MNSGPLEMGQRARVIGLDRPVRPSSGPFGLAEILEIAARAVGHPDRHRQPLVDAADVLAEQAAGDEGVGRMPARRAGAWSGSRSPALPRRSAWSPRSSPGNSGCSAGSRAGCKGLGPQRKSEETIEPGDFAGARFARRAAGGRRGEKPVGVTSARVRGALRSFGRRPRQELLASEIASASTGSGAGVGGDHVQHVVDRIDEQAGSCRRVANGPRTRSRADPRHRRAAAPAAARRSAAPRRPSRRR